MKDEEIVRPPITRTVWVRGATFQAACVERDRLRALTTARNRVFAFSGVGVPQDAEQFATTSTGFPVYRSRTP